MARKRSKTTRGFERLLSASRRQGLAKRPWRYRQKRATIKLTNAQKKARKEKKSAERQLYSDKIKEVQKYIRDKAIEIQQEVGTHSVQHIIDDIYQTHRLKTMSKKVGLFNAFVSLQMEQLNADVPEGEPRAKVTAHMSDIATKWAGLTKEEKESEALKERAKQLEDTRENKEIGHHNVELAAFHDSRITVAACKDALARLTMRTGDESILITVRSDPSHFNAPDVFQTSTRVGEFFSVCRKISPEELGARMEGYMVSGAEGVVRSYTQKLLHDKKELAALILAKLREAAGNTKIPRMYYSNFEDHITRQHGIILKNWPLKKFQNPSAISSSADVRILITAFTNGTTHFHKMSRSELEQWEEGYEAREAGGLASVQETRERREAGASEGQGEEGQAAPNQEQAPSSENGTTGANDDGAGVTNNDSAGLTNSRALGTSTFVNTFTVTTANGEAMQTTKKPRKRRSDAGVPRKKRRTVRENDENGGNDE